MQNHTKTRILYMVIYVLAILIVLLAYENFVAMGANRTEHVPTTYIESDDVYTVEENINSDILTNEDALNDYVNETIGSIYIPRLDMEAPILQGASNSNDDMQKTMKHTIGHEPGSYLPGEGKQIVLSGHREEQFSKLEDIKEGDIIIVQILDNQFLYEVSEMKIVKPQGDEAIEYVRGDSDEESLVLYTCYPFVPLSVITDRYVVKAKRIKSKTYDEAEAEETFDIDKMEEVQDNLKEFEDTESTEE